MELRLCSGEFISPFIIGSSKGVVAPGFPAVCGGPDGFSREARHLFFIPSLLAGGRSRGNAAPSLSCQFLAAREFIPLAPEDTAGTGVGTGATLFPSWKPGAIRGMLSAMGNKDRRRREAKKPKKKTPKLAPPTRGGHPIVTHTVSTPTTPQKNPTNSQ